MDTEGTEVTEGGNLGKRASFKPSGGYNWLKGGISRVTDKIEDIYSNAEYWKTQIPYYREVNYAFENEQYWKDYKKNTGFTPRYPYRTYGQTGEQAVISVYRGFKNLKRLYG